MPTAPVQAVSSSCTASSVVAGATSTVPGTLFAAYLQRWNGTAWVNVAWFPNGPKPAVASSSLTYAGLAPGWYQAWIQFAFPKPGGGFALEWKAPPFCKVTGAAGARSRCAAPQRAKRGCTRPPRQIRSRRPR
ncbi:MAG: hypothetical protein ABR583_00840 [Gaiellaceae bacterium]